MTMNFLDALALRSVASRNTLSPSISPLSLHFLTISAKNCSNAPIPNLALTLEKMLWSGVISLLSLDIP